MQVIERRVRIRRGRRLITARQVKSKVKTRVQPETIYGNVPREGGVLDRAHQFEVGIGDGAHSRRISQADVVTRRRERKVKLLLQTDIATQVEFATAGACYKFFHL